MGPQREREEREGEREREREDRERVKGICCAKVPSKHGIGMTRNSAGTGTAFQPT